MAADETSVAPTVADGVPCYHAHPAAAWLEELNADGGSLRLQAAIAFRVKMLFDETKADLNHTEEWEAILNPLSKTISFENLANVDYDSRDFGPAPDGARYIVTDAPLKKKTFFSKAATDLKNHLHREKKVEIFRNKLLKLYSRVGESSRGFRGAMRKGGRKNG